MEAPVALRSYNINSNTKRVRLLKILRVALLHRRRLRRKREQRKIERRWWVRPALRNRTSEGEFHTAMQHFRSGDEDYFHKYYRMSPTLFSHLCDLLRPHLQKKRVARQPISVEEQLAVTIRFLASGSAIQEIALNFRMGISTAARIIHVTCRKLWQVLQPLYMKEPNVEDLVKIEDGFNCKWQFPNCIGAVDGKHVHVECPSNSGSYFRNYKGYFSVVLMAVVDSNYNFVVIDVGGYGSQSDGGTFKNSPLGRALESGQFPLPPPKDLPGSSTRATHVFVGDEAFQLRPDFLRPYPGQGLDRRRRIFNYRLSRARRCVENAFGILATRWRIYRRPINVSIANGEAIVKATCVLHNFLMAMNNSEGSSAYCPLGYADSESQGELNPGQWRNSEETNPSTSLNDLPATNARNFARLSSMTREVFADYFSSETGAVPWQ